ncbi:MAG: FecR family protein [Spirosomaceae bacterium]|nr:FecR family protein [Spirosomataceae bacterium]
MSKQSFDYLIEKYLNGTTTEEEKKLVEQWYALVGDSSQIPKTSKEWAAIKERIWRKISLKTSQHTIGKMLSRRNLVAVAASVLMIISFSFWYFGSPVLTQTSQLIKNELIIVVNDGNAPKRILLSDNSVVILKEKASISYLRNFGNGKREVKLSGEAFFEIKRDTTRPFLVETAKTITRVLGTSFTIKEVKGKEVKVEVKSGLVSVYDKKSTDKKDNGVLLTANQKVTFHDNQNHFVIGLVEKPLPLVSKNQVSYSMRYDNITLADIKKELEEIYGIDILLEEKTTGMCKITGDLSGESLYDTLDIISLILNTDYQVQGTSILITGKGC